MTKKSCLHCDKPSKHLFQGLVPVCGRHYAQLYCHGAVSPRTRFDKNEIEIQGGTCLMTLYDKRQRARGIAIFDRRFKEEVEKHKWSMSGLGYVLAWVDGRSYKLHQFVLQKRRNSKDGLIVDHINGNPLDNRLVNLRLVSHVLNVRNRRGVRGVYFSERHHKWRAEIGHAYRNIYLGLFGTKEEAIEARYEAEGKYWQTV